MKIETGMYVRTTYGIGKINKEYIVYDDGGYFWYLSCMTDNPKIEIGIYLDYEKSLLLGEVQKNHTIKYEHVKNNKEFANKIWDNNVEYVCYVPVENGIPRNASLYDDHKFKKASYNIIDLIEEGDIVEYRIAGDLYIAKVEGHPEFDKWVLHIFYLDEMIDLKDLIIISVVTHEQFESIKYKIED